MSDAGVKELTGYLDARDGSERMQCLARLDAAACSLPLGLVSDLLLLELSRDEKKKLISMADRSDAEGFEHFLVVHARGDDQPLALAALKLWAQETPRTLATKLVEEIARPDLPDQNLARILDSAWLIGPRQVADACLSRRAWRDCSPTTRALMLKRFTQLGVHDEALLHDVESLVTQAHAAKHPSQPDLLLALECLARHRPEQLLNLVEGPMVPSTWRDVILAMYQVHATAPQAVASLRALLLQLPKTPEAQVRLAAAWPSLWVRHALPAEIVARFLAWVTARRLALLPSLLPPRITDWEQFAGIEPEVLAASIQLVEPELRTEALVVVGGLLPDQKSALPRRPTRQRTALPDERAYHERQRCFDLWYRSDGKMPPKPGRGVSPWSELAQLDLETPAGVARLAVLGRHLTGVYLQLACKMIARCRGADVLIPVLQDYLTTTDPIELGALVEALAGIDTLQTRALLVRLLDRTEVDVAIKLEICRRLRDRELGPLQAELRRLAVQVSSAANMLKLRALDLEFLEALQSLLAPEPEVEKASGSLPNRQQAKLHPVLERQARELIKQFVQLPEEVKSSLRTAQLILDALKENIARERLDISPSINMQYKAIETLFVARFADRCLRLAQSAGIQKKLDLLGYGRHGSQGTSEFERHLASLPHVRDIPSFSQYKLGAVLGAAASYRPGRRFSLDGLKAYALFLLAFCRKDCKFGLAECLPLKFASDDDLGLFVRDLHLFNDIRNRAVHGGLPVSEFRAVEALWHMVAAIINKTLELG